MYMKMLDNNTVQTFIRCPFYVVMFSLKVRYNK